MRPRVRNNSRKSSNDRLLYFAGSNSVAVVHDQSFVKKENSRLMVYILKINPQILPRWR